MLNCFEGYLTPACKTCPDWADGTDGRGLGCACHFPIMHCPHFAKACKEEENRHYILETTDSFLGQTVYFKELSSSKEPPSWYGQDVLNKNLATKYTLDEGMEVARYLRKTWDDHYKVVRV